MTCVTTIGVDGKENIVADPTDRLHPDFAVVSTGILLLQCGSEKDARRVIETETSFTQIAPALGLIPLKEHAG